VVHSVTAIQPALGIHLTTLITSHLSNLLTVSVSSFLYFLPYPTHSQYSVTSTVLINFLNSFAPLSFHHIYLAPLSQYNFNQHCWAWLQRMQKGRVLPFCVNSQHPKQTQNTAKKVHWVFTVSLSPVLNDEDSIASLLSSTLQLHQPPAPTLKANFWEDHLVISHTTFTKPYTHVVIFASCLMMLWNIVLPY
jgi:hypothetical protein